MLPFGFRWVEAITQFRLHLKTFLYKLAYICHSSLTYPSTDFEIDQTLLSWCCLKKTGAVELSLVLLFVILVLLYVYIMSIVIVFIIIIIIIIIISTNVK